jgi:hypothetical protein
MDDAHSFREIVGLTSIVVAFALFLFTNGTLYVM